MKKIMLTLCMVLIAASARADYLLKFKDKSAHVWDGYYEKGSEYCNRKSYGEYCVAKKDVVSIEEVPAGTQASEYGVSSLGDPDLDQRRDENIKALDSLSCTQLGLSTSRKAREAYRNECMTREEREAWEEEQARLKMQQREARHEEENVRLREEEERKKREAELKVEPARPRNTP